MSSYTLILRRYEEEFDGNKYHLLNASESLGHIKDIALKFNGEPGDILVICDTAYITDIANRCDEIYVVMPSGEVRLAPEIPNHISPSKSWIDAWEGDRFDAEDLLNAARDAYSLRKDIVMCGVDYAKTMVSMIRDEDSFIVDAINTAERLVTDENFLDELSILEARSIVSKIYKIYLGISRIPENKHRLAAYYLFYATISDATHVACGEHTYSLHIQYDGASEEMKDIILRRIPMKTIMIALLEASDRNKR